MENKLILSAKVTDLVVATPEFKDKTAKEVHNNLEISPSFEQTYIVLIAVHKDNSKNFITKISCKKGAPIGGHLYDTQSDSYHVECADYFNLGFVPISFVAKIKGLDSWQMRVPIPESVLKKYFTSFQKKEIRNFKNQHKSETYKLQFIQMLDVN